MSEKPKEFGDKDCIHINMEDASCKINKGVGSGRAYCTIMWETGSCSYKEKPCGGTICMNCRNLHMVKKNPNDEMFDTWDYYCGKTKEINKCWVTGKMTNTYKLCKSVNTHGNCNDYNEKSMPWQKAK